MQAQVDFNNGYFSLKENIIQFLSKECVSYETEKRSGYAIFPAEKGTVAHVKYRLAKVDYTNPQITQKMREERTFRMLRLYGAILTDAGFTVEGPFAELDIPYLVAYA